MPAGAGPAAASEAGVLRGGGGGDNRPMRLRVPHRVAGVGQLTDCRPPRGEPRAVIFNLIEEFPPAGRRHLVPDLCAA
jgi:hypothetical protein